MSGLRDWSHRHPGTQQVIRWFTYDHLPVGRPRDISMSFAQFAEGLLDELHDGSELTTCLRKLLEAKDCAVRQAIADGESVELSDNRRRWVHRQRPGPAAGQGRP